jgi:hypothetical protein
MILFRKSLPKSPRRLVLCGATAICVAVTALFASPLSLGANVVVGKPRTLAFVVPTWKFAAYESKFWDECPEGAAISQDEVWWRSLSIEERGRLTKNGALSTDARNVIANHRGPNGEDVCWQPKLFKTPRLRQATGPISYGFNLDGTEDGRATPKTCAHEKFATSPDGNKNVDNQLYRVLGCTVGWRNFGIIASYANEGRKSSARNVILMEVTDVDDPRNDNDVTVTFYKAMSQFPKDAVGNVLPYGSYRIDADNAGTPRYKDKARGKIVNGVLTTDAADVKVPFYGTLDSYAEILFRDSHLRLEIAADGSTAKGIIGGYYDLESFWSDLRNSEVNSSHADFDCPAMYEAIYRLADGYPDPKTGQCTAISSAYAIEAVAAFAIHPDEPTDKKTARK